MVLCASMLERERCFPFFVHQWLMVNGKRRRVLPWYLRMRAALRRSVNCYFCCPTSVNHTAHSDPKTTSGIHPDEKPAHIGGLPSPSEGPKAPVPDTIADLSAWLSFAENMKATLDSARQAATALISPLRWCHRHREIFAVQAVQCLQHP